MFGTVLEDATFSFDLSVPPFFCVSPPFALASSGDFRFCSLDANLSRILDATGEALGAPFEPGVTLELAPFFEESKLSFSFCLFSKVLDELPVLASRVSLVAPLTIGGKVGFGDLGFSAVSELPKDVLLKLVRSEGNDVPTLCFDFGEDGLLTSALLDSERVLLALSFFVSADADILLVAAETPDVVFCPFVVVAETVAGPPAL